MRTLLLWAIRTGNSGNEQELASEQNLLSGVRWEGKPQKEKASGSLDEFW